LDDVSLETTIIG